MEQTQQLDFYQRWQHSRGIINELRIWKHQLVVKQNQINRERAILLKQICTAAQATIALQHRQEGITKSIQDCTNTLHLHRISHQALCTEINQRCGPGTTRHWRRAKQVPTQDQLSTAPLAPFAGIKTIVITPTSPDPNYGRSGLSSSS